MSFKTINNTTPFFEGTDAHTLVGHSSYSTTGTTSFSAIHTEVAGQEYVPFGASATTSGPRRIGRDEFIEDIGGSGAIGEDKLVPVGDAFLPMYIILTAYCVVRFLITHFKRGALMKKSFSILLLALMFSPFAHAQLADGDIVTLRYVVNEWDPSVGQWGAQVDNSYYLEGGVNGLRAVKYPTDDCLWQMRVVKNGNNTNYTFQTLPREGQSTYYLSYNTTNDPQKGQLRLLQTNNPTAFSFNVVEGEDGKYMMGHMSTTYYYPSWYTNITLRVHENYSLVGWENGQVDLYVEKWKQVGGGAPTGVFSPEKIEFTYAEDEAAATKQATPVTFTLNTEVESHYECVPRPDEVWLRRSTMNADMSQVQVNLYWESANSSVSSLLRENYSATSETEDRALMTLSGELPKASPLRFTITPNGESPMGLKQYIYPEGDTIKGIERWVDYADRVIAEYVVNGKTYKETMRVVRKAYHWDTLPAFTFSVVPVTYTFAKEGENVDITVRPTHQHGRVLYNLDNQTIKTVYDPSGQPTPVPLNTLGWKLDISFSNNENEWLEGERNGDYKIKVTAEANGTGAKRTSEMTGTFTGPDGHSGTFTIPLAQRSIEGGIQFYTQAGQGASDEEKRTWNKSKDKQQVHTAERTIYYLPEQEIELRLPESGYSGYMRWYDYTTGMDPYYNENRLDSTLWILSPRAANNQPFFAINTPRSNDYKEEGRSYGFVAFNKKEGANVGGHLDEGNTSNPAPRIKGWNYNPSTLDSAYQIMACDVSAYTDYTINKTTFGSGQNATVRIDSITEPTLSYRQLFHLKPAKEMADKFDSLQAGEYLENYHYKAPAGKMVLLATEFRYRKARSHFSEMCYFYRDSEGIIKRIDETNATFTWQADGVTINNPQYTAAMDYLWVRSDEPKTVVYTLTATAKVGGKTCRIAKFTVQYVPQNTHGPSSNTLITEARIRAEYKVLASINFNSSNNHLPWEESSYGFMYSSGELAKETNFKRGASQGVFPFYGEYFLVDRVNKDWAKAEQHGGAGKGYALYVDGTMEPGLVASISADARICSDQTMYCSAWFCNPTPQNWNSEGNPIFRCNVQGRNIVEIVDGKTTFTPWEDVEMYFVGELPKNSGWQQIFFPIESAHSYDETRVSIYNFATTNLGNDFLVDDIHLFVSQMPIVAYQGKMACRSIDSDSTSAAAVLRIDYSNIQSSGDGFMYYQIYNETYKDLIDESKVGAPVVLRGACAYYHADSVDHAHHNMDDKYGSVAIPPKTFDPKKHNETYPTNKVDTFLSVSKFLDELVERGEQHGRAYVRTVNSGVTKWLLYVAHIIPNTRTRDSALVSLYDGDSYVMRMAYTPNELATPECNMQTHIHATQRTIFELRNSNRELINQRDSAGNLLKDTERKNVQHFMMHSVKNCANELYFLDVKVVNHLALNTGLQPNDEKAPIYADWLVGEPMDDIFGQEKPTDSVAAAAFVAKQKEVDAKFKEKYGYTHGQVTTAIMYDMRRLPDPQGKTIKEKNPNYHARSFKELNPNAFLSPQNYDIVRHLHEHELLHMYDTTAYFYLASQDTARYWVFPIAETAKTLIGSDTVVLKDCNEPRWVTVSSQSSEYFLNITPLDKKDKNFIQRTQIPTVKVVKKNSNTLLIPIKEIAKNGEEVNIKLFGRTDTIILKTNELPAGISFYDVERAKTITTPTIEAGKEYTIRIPFQSKEGWNWVGHNDAAENACRVGYVYLNLAVVPDVLVWQPTEDSFNGWGKDENWKGVVDSIADGIIDDTDQIDSTKLIEGYVPMAGTKVIIPKLNNPLLYPYIVPEEEHNHYPMTVYHDQHKCDTIYFADSAHINNQHLLEYKAAFVDMEIPVGTWTMVSAPLQDLYAGDFFIPHKGDYETGKIIEEHNPFMVEEFQGSRSSYAAYAFYASYYNRAVRNWYTDGSVKETTSTDFVMSNSLGDAIHVGSGVQLMGFGLANDKDLNIRLPKPDTKYTSSSGREVNVDKTNAKRLAFTPDTDGNMTITLKNALADSLYVFGNPTMAFINMHEFLHANEEVLEHVYYRFQGEAWQAYTSATASIDRFLPPMEAVLLKAKNKASTSVEVVLKASQLTLDNRINPLSEHTDPVIIRKTSAKAPAQDKSEPAVMTIYAITDKAYARTVLATSPTAHDYYHSDEDALFISSGVEAGTSSVLRTPMNMYTVAEQVPMMADVRQGISSIPLSMLVYEKNRQSQMTLAFYLSQNWNKEVYLLDSITGARTRILNGLMLTVPMPDNHQLRYYIEGPDEYIGSNANQDNTPTGVEQTQSYHPQSKKVLHNQQIYILHNGHTYTLTGLEVKW